MMSNINMTFNLFKSNLKKNKTIEVENFAAQVNQYEQDWRMIEQEIILELGNDNYSMFQKCLNDCKEWELVLF